MKKSLCLAILALVSVCCNNSKTSKNATKAETDWVVLFDGTSTDAFRGYGIKEFPQGVWNVVNGVLIANPDSANRDLITRKRYKDFELEYEWAVDTTANSGVFFHM